MTKFYAWMEWKLGDGYLKCNLGSGTICLDVCCAIKSPSKLAGCLLACPSPEKQRKHPCLLSSLTLAPLKWVSGNSSLTFVACLENLVVGINFRKILTFQHSLTNWVEHMIFCNGNSSETKTNAKKQPHSQPLLANTSSSLGSYLYLTFFRIMLQFKSALLKARANILITKPLQTQY